MQVLFTRSFVPIAAFVVAKAANQDVDFVVVNNNIDTRAVLNHPEGPIRGNFVIASHFAQSDEAASKVFLGANTKYKVEIQQWIEFAAGELSPKEELEVAISRLNSHLQFRTFLAGYKLSLADLAVFEALKAHPKFMGMRNKHTNQLVHVIRWFTYVEQLPEVDQAVKMLFAVIKKGGSTKALQQLNDGAKAVQKAGEDQSNQASMELDLPGAKMGDFCTRFPPEASGFLHIGHAKAAIINDYFARRYKGKLIFRFDDTNPTKEKSEYEESIKQDLVTLNISPDVSTYTSDYFELMLEYATRMIKEEKFYCDKTPTEELRAERLAGVESKYRTQPVEENLRLWKEMQNGTPEGLSCCLRARINMQADNKCLRDPIMYRCNTNPHPHTGDKYKVYPTYDFACPVVDSVEGVTHAFRTNEYHDRNDQYYWVCDALGIRKPHLEDFSRLNMMYSLMSKRKLTHFVDTGLVTGWDDPRFPTVRGLLRRGLRVEALRQFVLQQGVSKNINWMEWEKLWNFNKRIIDPIAPRYTALLPEKIVPLHIVDGPSEPKSESLAKHKKNAELGNKTTIFYNKIFIDQVDAALIKDNEEITLMDWGNCVITKIEKNQAGEVVRMEGKLNLQGSVKTTKWKLTWLADTPDLVPVQLIDYGHLITKVKLEETDDLEKFINRNSKKITQGLGDLNLRKLKKGETIQLERRGYYIVDQELDDAHNTPLVLICIPDGRKEKN